MMLMSEEYYRMCEEEEEKKRQRVENIGCTLGLIALVAALFAAWWFAPAFADEVEDEEIPTEMIEKFVFCQPDSYVYIRARASKHAIEEGRLYLGDSVFVDRQVGQWSHCVGLACEAGEGWVKSDFLGEWEPEIYPDGMKMVTTKGRVNARFSINGKIRKRLGKGAAVTVWAIAEDWSVTSQGMIKSEFLEGI